MLDERCLQKLFLDAVKRSGAVGAQMSIVKADQQVDLAAGLAHAGLGLAMNVDTLMQIGSITKLFNAVIVLSLVEQGALVLDAPVRYYIPHLEIADQGEGGALTLRRLLAMCSGLDNGPYVHFGSGDDALARYVGHLRDLPQHFAPGTFFGYSNAGICIAGHVASRVAGKPWEALLRERIIEPAGLGHSAVLEADVLYQTVSAGHVQRSDGRFSMVDPVFAMGRARAPSGRTMAQSMRDLARFGTIFINGGRADTGARILSEESVNLMMTPQIAVPTRKFGSAWCIGPYTAIWNGLSVYGHGGTALTATGFLHWIPEQRGVIAFAVNTHAAMGEFAEAVLGDIAKAAFGVCKPRIDIPECSSDLIDHRRYIGTYEQLGITMDVTVGAGGTLRARLAPQAGYEPIMETELSATLVPLSCDRFLVTPDRGRDSQRGLVDMAFFGSDGEGRAAHALNLVFPMSRI